MPDTGLISRPDGPPRYSALGSPGPDFRAPQPPQPPAAPSAPGPRPRRRWRRALLSVAVLLLAMAISSAVTVVVMRSVYAQGWREVFREDFDTPVPAGQFPGTTYAKRFTVYPDGWSDTSGKGRYAPSKVLSVADGSLRWTMQNPDGTPLGAAVLPTLPTYGQIYGRYTVRFRADAVPGYGLAFLLWPDSEKWPRDGEIDFPEGPLDGKMKAVAHYATEKGTFKEFDTDAGFNSWHTATIEWSPDLVTFTLDGSIVGQSTTMVPTRSMHWVLQTGTDALRQPALHSKATIEVDWLEAEAWR